MITFDHVAVAVRRIADASAMVEDLLGGLGYIGQYLVGDSDRDSYRMWLRQYLAPAMKDVGYEPKPGESDEQRTLRSLSLIHI